METFLALADKGPLDKRSQAEEDSMLASLSLEDRKKHKLKKKKVGAILLCDLTLAQITADRLQSQSTIHMRPFQIFYRFVTTS